MTRRRETRWRAFCEHQGARPAPRFAAGLRIPCCWTLYDYWLTRRGDQVAMVRADLDPIEMPRLLPNLILSDVGDGGRAIRYRLVGTDIVTAHGSDYTGKTIEELTTRLDGRLHAKRSTASSSAKPCRSIPRAISAGPAGSIAGPSGCICR